MVGISDGLQIHHCLERGDTFGRIEGGLGIVLAEELPTVLRLEHRPQPTKVIAGAGIGRDPVLVPANLVCAIGRRLGNCLQFIDRGWHLEIFRPEQRLVVELGKAMDVERNRVLLILECSESPNRWIPVLLLDAGGAQLFGGQRRKHAFARERADVVAPQQSDIWSGATDRRRLQFRDEVKETLKRVDPDIRILIAELLNERAHFVAVRSAENRPVLDSDFRALIARDGDWGLGWRRGWRVLGVHGGSLSQERTERSGGHSERRGARNQ